MLERFIATDRGFARRGVERHRPALRSHEAIKVSHNLDFTRSPNPAG
jgi:hypothetical protein